MIIFLRRNIQLFRKKYGMTVRKVVLLLGVLCGLLGHEEAYLGEEKLSMYAESYALMDGDTGRILVGKADTEPMANASTTKILTCIVTLEHADMNDLVLISANAASQPRVRLGIGEGEQYPLKDLLYGLMLESYNDCAVAIAEHVAGSEESFAKMLNQKAKEIGCIDTYFITPNGLDAEHEGQFHHTTAQDLCKIMAYCTWQSPQKEAFLQITQTKEYQGAANDNTYTFINRNSFLGQMEGVLTGKTGYTNKAGYCYVAALETNGEKYCIALLACGWPNNRNYKWKDARELFSYGIDNYEAKTVRVPSVVKEVRLDGCTEAVEFEDLHKKMILQMETQEWSSKLLLSEADSVEAVLDIDERNLQLPIKKGDNIGRCRIYLNGELWNEIPLIAKVSVRQWNFKTILYLIFSKYLSFSL